MAKQALEGKRLNAFAMDASDLTIIGLDTKDGPEHPLYDERIFLPIDEAMVRNIRAFGVIEAINVRKNGPNVEVVDGRQRVRHARIASQRNVEEGLPPILVPCLSPIKATDVTAIGAALVLLVGFGCSTSSTACPTTDAGIVEADGAVPVTPSVTHALCWAGGAGFQRCERVTCRDPFDGRLLVDQANQPLEPRCGDDGVPSCWGVLGPDPSVRELIAEGVEFVWCDEPI